MEDWQTRTRLLLGGNAVVRTLPLFVEAANLAELFAQGPFDFVVDDERNKCSTLGTISYLPAVFGCHLAAYTLKQLTAL